MTVHRRKDRLFKRERLKIAKEFSNILFAMMAQNRPFWEGEDPVRIPLRSARVSFFVSGVVVE